MVFQNPILNVHSAHRAVLELYSAPHTNVPISKTYLKTRIKLSTKILISYFERFQVKSEIRNTKGTSRMEGLNNLIGCS